MSARIEGIVARLHGLHPRLIDLSLDRLRDLLAKLDHPERRLPPVMHVAGTNGKGSTCAFLRAMAEAAGQRVHVYTSPHLVRFNERIRVAGELVSDEALAAALEHVEQVNAGAAITVFEVITAVAFHLFAQTPADLCVLEVGLGGRGDATNVIDRPAACAITSISLDHRELLGETLAVIAAEKAGIMKPGVPVAIGTQPAEVLDVLLAAAERVGAPVRLRDRDWHMACGPLQRRERRPRPAAAVAAGRVPARQCRHRHRRDACVGAGRWMPPASPRAEWPARLQRLHGRLAALLPADWELWLDGGHNPGAGDRAGRASAVVVGSAGASGRRHEAGEGRHRVPPAVGSACNHSVGGGRTGPARRAAGRGHRRGVRRRRAAGPARGRRAACVAARRRARVLICGSLYLAGEVLKLDR